MLTKEKMYSSVGELWFENSKVFYNCTSCCLLRIVAAIVSDSATCRQGSELFSALLNLALSLKTEIRASLASSQPYSRFTLT
jgi:hypothetical protein